MQPKLRFLVMTLSVIFLSFVSGFSFAQTNTATVSTDKFDYAPGATVLISGGGFDPGETVTLQVEHVGSDPMGTDPQYHQPWTTVAKSDGTIESSWAIPTDGDAYGASYILTADGQTSLRHAETFFSDGSTVNQWADATTPAQWKNTLNGGDAQYFQGEITPFVYNVTNLVVGHSYTISVKYDYYAGSQNAGGYAEMRTYNVNRSPTPFTASTTPTPDNSYTGTPINGVFYTVNADITNVTAPVKTTGGSVTTARVDITFTATGTVADIYWGMYLSKTGTVTDFGTSPTNGAGSWPGGSMAVTVTTNIDGTNLSTNTGTNPGSNIFNGQISGMKYLDANKNGSKQGGENGLPNWVIYLDQNDNNTLDAGEVYTTTDANGNYSFSDIFPNTYVVREQNQSNYIETQPGNTTATNKYTVVISSAIPISTGNIFGNFTCSTPKPTISTTTPTTFCAGGSVLLTSSSTTGTYQWKKDGVSIGGANSQTYSATESGVYTVTITEFDCPNTSDGTTITVNDKPSIAAISSPAAVCAGSNLSLTAPTVTANGSTVSSQGWEIETAVGSNAFTSFASPYTVAYADNGKNIRYTATNGCGTTTSNAVAITVNPYVICAAYNGDYFANTESTTTGGTATVNLVFNIAPGSGACNSLDGLQTSDFTITFKDNNSVTATIVDGTLNYDPNTHTVTAQATLILGNVYSGDVTAVLTLNNNNFTFGNNCLDQPIITVSTRTNDFVTGGGYIIPSNSSFAGRPGSTGANNVNGFKNNFGFNVKWNKTMKQLQGNWNTIIRRTETDGIHLYQVKAKPSTLVVRQLTGGGYRTDIVFSSVNFQDLTCGCWSDGGNKSSVNLTVVDYGEPGAGVDRIYILIKDKNGNTWYESNKTTDLTFSNESVLPLLNQGNIQIHTGGSATSTIRDIQTSPTALNPVLEFKATPNPTYSYFTIQLSNQISGKVNLRVIDVLGRVVETRQNLNAGQTIQLGTSYRPGVYIIEMIQGNQRKQLKLVKTPD